MKRNSFPFGSFFQKKEKKWNKEKLFNFFSNIDFFTYLQQIMNSIIFDNWLNVSSKSFNKGIHFGQKSIRLAKTNFWHPLMSDYFLGIRQNVSVLNTQQTLKSLLRAFHIIALILNKKGRILIINTNPEFFRLCNNLTNITLIGKYKFFIEKKK